MLVIKIILRGTGMTRFLRNTILDTDYVTRRFIASLAWAACWVHPWPQCSFVFGVDVRQECGRGEVNADDAAVGSAGTPACTAAFDKKVITILSIFSELGIPQSRSWLCDAVIRLACAAR